MISEYRIGHGYDVHQLTKGRKLILGGVDIPYEKGLLGHSDADVLTHSVMDALLGAAGMDNIGIVFPDSDPLYEGINSIKLLCKVYDMLFEAGYAIANIDATIIAQAPKLAPYTRQMADNIAKSCHMTPSCVNVKATTEEHLGFTGRGEGIAAHAVTLIFQR